MINLLRSGSYFGLFGRGLEATRGGMGLDRAKIERKLFGSTLWVSAEDEEEEEGIGEKRTKEKGGLKLKLNISNPALRRLLSGVVPESVSRTVVAPLETIMTHLMVGSGGESTTEVFRDIMKHEGWKGLFRGNLVNVIRVAPACAVELFVFETVNKKLMLNMLHVLIRILEQEGVAGWYRGIGPSCLKLVPGAGISFMCYEACKKILVENNEET